MNCNKDLEPSGTDILVVSDEKTVVRYTDCLICGHVNILNYNFSAVTSSYDKKLDKE
jgi:hypothetical protein